MKVDDNIVFESTYDNIKAFIKGKDLVKLETKVNFNS